VFWYSGTGYLQIWAKQKPPEGGCFKLVILLGDLEMTPAEHKLVACMFAHQAMQIKALIELLKARGVAEADDFAAFAELSSAHFDQDMLVAVAEDYTHFATEFGLPDPGILT
jgi:hypothetical protein